MRRDTLLLILGLVVFATPFLGIPQSWKTILLFGAGTLVCIVALVYRFEVRRYVRAKSAHTSYAEHDPTKEVA